MDLHAHFDDATRRDWQEATEGTVRFAMVGLGFWTRERAIPAAEAADHCEPTVAVSGSPEKAEHVADDCGPMNHVVSYDEFHDGAAADAYDAIYVATPNAYHLEYVETAAELGKGVLCEKPMEATVERAESMVAAADRGDVPLMVAYRMQTEPAVRRMRELVARGFVGDPVHVHGHMSQLLLEMNPDPGQWRLDPELSGEGTSVMDLGVYPLNTTRFLLDADPVAVQSMQHSGHEAFEAVPDERSAFQVRFPSGVLASFSASQNAVISSRLAVTGTEGELALEPAFFDDRPRRVTLSRGGTRAEVEVEPVDQMEEEFAYFADRVLSGTPPAPDGRHGLVDMRAMDAVYEAAETGETVEVGE